MIKKFNILFITLFNIGKIKYAPGTLASFATCVIFLFLSNFLNLVLLALCILVIFLYSLIAINLSYESFNSDDPQEIVIDEFVGQSLPLLAVPVYETLYSMPLIFYYILSFIIFRFFDIFKPFPINYIDKNTKGSLGIMLDDIIAGLFTVILLILVFFLIGG